MKIKPNEIKLYVGTVTSVIGNRFFDFANNLFLSTSNLNSTTLLAIYQSLEAIVSILLNLFGGAISDISKRKNMIVIVTDILSAMLMLLLLISPSEQKITMVIIVNVLLSVLSSFNSPASKSLVKFAVEKERILKFNSIMQVSNQLIKVIAPLVTLVLMDKLGYDTVILINFITFITSAYFEFKLDLFEHKTEDSSKRKESIFTGIKQGFVYLLRYKKILSLIITASLVNIFFAGYDLYLPYSMNLFEKSYIFGQHIHPYTLFTSLEAVGGIIGGIFTYKLLENKETSYLFYFLALSGLSIVFFYLSLVMMNNLLFSALFILLYSIFLVMFNVMLFSSIQKEVSDEYIGRVFSIIFTVATLFMPIGTFIFSHLFLPTSSVQYLIIGIGVSIVSILGLYAYKFYSVEAE
ncbi:sugar phosphate permease [Nicoletella semolina]|uniref:Sugar phosphate permease n=1 Tax=Nicoletella semolina TaxID=271160 RepID=A0A4R2N9T0_9PAST|nr:MFS transporter [Nicoletella semolina]MDH2925326.1 hypothetical protein [Nicoletella semolina]TCP17803.1 sugar phosphate permease [Nicoletella semolina]